MGVNVNSHNLIMECATILKDLWPMSFVILGKQIMRKIPGCTFRLAQKYYESLTDTFDFVACVDIESDSEHVTEMDLNAEQKKFFGAFELLYNGGTMEHVDNQQQGWRNSHYFLREGGIAVHVCPLVNGWKKHGRYLYTPEFFDELISRNKYEVIYREIWTHPRGKAMYIAFRKTVSNPFTWKPCEPHVVESV